MKICKSCGGIIGQEYFNPEECAYIVEQMKGRQIQETFANHMRMLKERIAALMHSTTQLTREVRVMAQNLIDADESDEFVQLGHSWMVLVTECEYALVAMRDEETE